MINIQIHIINAYYFKYNKADGSEQKQLLLKEKRLFGTSAGKFQLSNLIPLFFFTSLCN